MKGRPGTPSHMDKFKVKELLFSAGFMISGTFSWRSRDRADLFHGGGGGVSGGGGGSACGGRSGGVLHDIM